MQLQGALQLSAQLRDELDMLLQGSSERTQIRRGATWQQLNLDLGKGLLMPLPPQQSLVEADLSDE